MGYWAIKGCDALNLHMPNNHFVTEGFLHKQLLLWNPNINLGQPVLDSSTTIFHPALIFYLVFSPWLANTVEILLGLLLTFLGIWYFLRQQYFGVFPAATGALIYVLSGPVFFLHNYHLGFMAIVILPWCLWIFHQHDRTGHRRWLWLAAGLCIIAVHSVDPDTLLYLYIGLVIDRLVCLPRTRRKNYITMWIVILLLSGLTGLLIYLPLYEWLIHSSRLTHSYVGILTPNLSNMLTAIFINQWLTECPYDVYYFYFGPAVILLVLAGLARLNKSTYILHYFLFSLVIPFSYIIIRFLQSHYSNFLISLDLWRSMFVFCLGLTLIASNGVRNILQVQRIQHWLSLVVSLIIIGFLIVPAVIRSGKTDLHRWNLSVQPAYIQDSKFIQDLQFYRALAKVFREQEDYGRVSIMPGTDNVAILGGLKILPAYTSFYNNKMEKSMCLDGLISSSKYQPYWMRLEDMNSRILAIYGVRFVINLAGAGPEEDNTGWIKQEDLSWSGHRVYENQYYAGRAYLVTPSGELKSGVKFLQDKPESVILEASSEEGDRVVLADLYYPGWQAFVNGKPVTSEVYHGCLRSISLPKGKHIVHWKYSGRIQRVGLILSAIALISLIAFLCNWPILKDKKI